MKEKVSIIVVGTEMSVSRVTFGITWQSLVMPNHDPLDGNFCQYLTAMKDTYSPVWLICNYESNNHKIRKIRKP